MADLEKVIYREMGTGEIKNLLNLMEKGRKALATFDIQKFDKILTKIRKLRIKSPLYHELCIECKGKGSIVTGYIPDGYGRPNPVWNSCQSCKK